MPDKISTCLWFREHGEVAAELYVSLFEDSRIVGTFRPDPDGPPLVVDFVLAGVPYQILNGGPHFALSEAASIVVHTDDQAETDHLWSALTAHGGSESRCGWLKDRFGLSWQVTPRQLIEMTSGPDKAAAGRVFQAMMGMKKIDIAGLKAAYGGR